MLRGFLPRNQIQQDALDRDKFSGINERIHAEQYSVEETFVKRERVVNVQNEIEDLSRCPGDGEQHADKTHGLDDAHLNLLRLGLGGARSCPTVGGHRTRLTTDGDQNTPVAEDDNQENDDVEGQKIPDPKGHLGGMTLPENQRVTDSVHYVGGRNCGSCSSGNAANPCECRGQVDHPSAQPLLSKRRVNNLQIAFNGNSGEIDQGCKKRTPGGTLAQNDQTEEISARSVEVNVAESDAVRDAHEETAD